ncbi:MAG: 3'-5' exoribonuclease YhaM family protein [Myxococcota bacterium]
MNDLPRVPVAELEPGRPVDSTYLIHRARRATTRHGQAYLHLEMGDASGQVPGRVWDRVDALEEILEEGAIVRVAGQVQTYRSETQIVVERARVVPAGQADPAAFLPTSRFDPEVMWEALRDLVSSLEDPWVRRFLDHLLDDPEVASRLRRAPAAMHIHHAWVGGLLEHVLSVCRVLDGVAAHYARYYPDLLDRSLLVAGGILHDLAKIWELTYDGAFGYTDEGRMVGHLVMGTELVGRVCDSIDGFPPETRLRLRHLVVGHHGKQEFGSPQLPQTPEAIVLHYVDDLDSKVNVLHTKLSAAGGPWTERVWSMGRPLWNVYHGRDLQPLPTDLPGGQATGAPASEPPAVAPSSPPADESPAVAPATPPADETPTVAPSSAPASAEEEDDGAQPPLPLDLFRS